MPRRIRWAACALAVLALALWQWPRAGVTPAASARSALADAPRYGPGAWSGAPGDGFALPIFDTSAPPGPFLETDGSLRVDRALRDLFDHFLLGGHAGARSDHAAALRAHLEQGEARLALPQAWALAERYLAYLDAHDRLIMDGGALAVDPASPSATLDVDAIRAWLAQRTRLRQTLLGAAVARAWFEEEEREQLAMLEGMPQKSEQREPAHPLDQAVAALRALHERDAPLEARRAFVAARHGEEAARRYEALENEERDWQQRFADYRRQATMLRAQDGFSAGERERALEALRTQMFPDDAQRLRAAALDS